MGGRAPGYRLSPDYFQMVKRMLAPDWAKKNALYYCAQSANSSFWVLFVSSYTTAINTAITGVQDPPATWGGVREIWNGSMWWLTRELDILKVLYFFPGWLCHFKGLFIPVWREIHRSKIPPVTSWQQSTFDILKFYHVSAVSFSCAHGFQPHVTLRASLSFLHSLYNFLTLSRQAWIFWAFVYLLRKLWHHFNSDDLRCIYFSFYSADPIYAKIIYSRTSNVTATRTVHTWLLLKPPYTGHFLVPKVAVAERFNCIHLSRFSLT